MVAISVSPVCSVSETGLSSAVAVCFSIRPLSGLEINLTSLSVPNCMYPSSTIYGVVRVLFVSVAVEAVETKSTLPPVLGSVSVFDAASE